MIPWTLLIAGALCNGTAARYSGAVDFEASQCPAFTLETCQTAYLEIAGEETPIRDCQRIAGYWLLETKVEP